MGDAQLKAVDAMGQLDEEYRQIDLPERRLYQAIVWRAVQDACGWNRIEGSRLERPEQTALEYIASDMLEEDCEAAFGMNGGAGNAERIREFVRSYRDAGKFGQTVSGGACRFGLDSLLRLVRTHMEFSA